LGVDRGGKLGGAQGEGFNPQLPFWGKETWGVGGHWKEFKPPRP